MPAPGKQRVLNIGEERGAVNDPTVQINITLTRSTCKRLIKMARAKGMTKEQPLIRLFINEGLDKGGY